jgi:hypothetical protein
MSSSLPAPPVTALSYMCMLLHLYALLPSTNAMLGAKLQGFRGHFASNRWVCDNREHRTNRSLLSVSSLCSSKLRRFTLYFFIFLISLLV